jgi:hypothetical protein
MTLGVVALAASWLVVVAALVLDLTGRWRKGAYFRWQGFGLLLGIGAVLTSAFAQLRGWPASQLHGLRMITDPVTVAGAALVVVGAFAQLRARRSGDGPAE